jgi:hypothetical protein
LFGRQALAEQTDTLPLFNPSCNSTGCNSNHTKKGSTGRVFEILPQSKGANIAIKASGIISESDYEAFLPEFGRRCEEVHQFRLLVDWEHLEGWDEAAVPVSFAQRIMHRWRCERLAILSDDPRRSGDIEFIRGLFTSRKLRVFPPAERDAAWSWLTGDSVRR